VVFEATRQRNTLVDFRWNKVYRADNGQPGKGRDMTGRCGEDLVLLVPVGTVLSDFETKEVIADLHAEGMTWTVEGGRGGLGNASFKSSTNRTPRFAQDGQEGTEICMQMELKLLADVGLLGFPNAGKSTLISRISAAKPKIADYPFTTKVPNLGVVSIEAGESFVVADIPGLIEGASQGTGLGHRFLKHVERCGVFIHLVAPDDSEHTARYRLETIERELEHYDATLLQRPRITVLTKGDLLQPEEQQTQRAQLEESIGGSVLCISSVSGLGVAQLVGRVWELLQQRKNESTDLEEPASGKSS